MLGGQGCCTSSCRRRKHVPCLAPGPVRLSNAPQPCMAAAAAADKLGLGVCAHYQLAHLPHLRCSQGGAGVGCLCKCGGGVGCVCGGGRGTSNSQRAAPVDAAAVILISLEPASNIGGPSTFVSVSPEPPFRATKRAEDAPPASPNDRPARQLPRFLIFSHANTLSGLTNPQKQRGRAPISRREDQ